MNEEKQIKLNQSQLNGFLQRHGSLEIVKKDFTTYLQAILDANSVEGEWVLMDLKDGFLILQKMENTT